MSGPITSGRTRRALKLGTLTGQVGSSYLWQSLLKPFRSLDAHQRELLDTHVRNALRMVESSTELRGAFTKLVQMLSMRDDLLPTEALDILSAARANVPPMPYAMIRQQVRAELGKLPERLFARFEHKAFAAASLGQVHRAELRSGEAVVVKVQYPKVEETVAQDLKNLGALLQVVTRIGRDVMGQRVDTASLHAELDERLSEELDYRKEAANIELFRELFADDPEIEIPRVFPELSSRRVLTMSLLDGYPLAEVLAPGVDQELKDWVAIKYFRAVCRQILHFGVLHTDPQPANYLVTHHPKLGVLDFGSIRVFPEELRVSYLRLARALLAADRGEMAAACRALDYLGDGDSPEAMIEILENLLEPLLEDRDYDFRRYRSLDKAIQVANVAIEKGLYRTPGHRLFLVRALIGLEAYVKQLGTIANWRRLFAEAVASATADGTGVVNRGR
ncbi:MAG TPA: AarF/ABC1/UbiB kinase family protein [Candidatus Binatia bacterium]|nr:AarF/ABC1/UbiB kinase family protein [Candidatus Binatia bacterium]